MVFYLAIIIIIRITTTITNDKLSVNQQSQFSEIMKKDINIGLGFKKEIDEEFFSNNTINPDFVEVAPENWIGLGGYWKQVLNKVADKYPIITHGLSLSVGSYDDLDIRFIKQVKSFMNEYDIDIYSEHLSFAKTNNAHLYDLLPIPFREDSIKHVSERIKQVQDIINKPLVIENVSYYTSVEQEILEIDFIKEILHQADCKMLLDVNNVYVNSFNHNYDAYDFIKKLPLDRVEYIHMAGHKKVSDNLIIDTHGESIIDEVYKLFDYTTSLMGNVPVLLERDFNFDDIKGLQYEMDTMREICKNNWI